MSDTESDSDGDFPSGPEQPPLPPPEERRITDRGFKHYTEFDSFYGGTVKVYESSGDTPGIYMKAGEGCVLLTFPMAEHLIKVLGVALRDHWMYQGQDE